MLFVAWMHTHHLEFIGLIRPCFVWFCVELHIIARIMLGTILKVRHMAYTGWVSKCSLLHFQGSGLIWYLSGRTLCTWFEYKTFRCLSWVFFCLTCTIQILYFCLTGVLFVTNKWSDLQHIRSLLYIHHDKFNPKGKLFWLALYDD